MKNARMRWMGIFLVLTIVCTVAFYTLEEPRHRQPPTHLAESQKSPLISKENNPELTGSLYAKAKVEGTVNIWTEDPSDVTWIGEAFVVRYPGIVVQYRTQPNTVERVLSDVLAGKKNVDLVWSSERLVRALKDRHLLKNPDWVSLGVSPENIGAQGAMAITNSWAFAVAYRNDLVNGRDVPNSWQQLTGPTYHGKMAASEQLFSHMVAGIGAAQDEVLWLTYAKKFAEETDTTWTNQLEQTLASGKRPFVVATSYSMVSRWKRKGIPVDFVIPQPVVITEFGSVIMTDAPHPNAALLLAAWLASTEGQLARERATFAVDLRTSSQNPLARQVRDSGLVIEDSESFLESRNRLIPKVSLIISLSKPRLSSQPLPDVR